MSNGSTALDRDNVMVTTELLFGYLVGKTRSQVLSFPDNQIVGETNSFWAQVRDVFFSIEDRKSGRSILSSAIHSIQFRFKDFVE